MLTAHGAPSGSPHRSVLRCALIVAGLLVASVLSGLLVASTAAASSDCADTFDCLRLDTQFNGSQPFAASQTFSMMVDLSSYDLQSNEPANCGPLRSDGNYIWGNNSAWFRFDTAVTGTLAVSADSSAGGSFNVLMKLYSATHDDPIDYADGHDLVNSQCTASGPQVALDAPAQQPVLPGDPTFVQLLASCGESASETVSACPNPIAAGDVKLTFTFTADDQDHDGVPDTLDQCPTQPGTVAAHGCPDADDDGVPDSADKCPTQPGPASTGGCPDSDGDGIPDYEDACPAQSGPASTDGCPDADGDGIPDSADKCPLVPGPASAAGCPDADRDGIPDSADKCPKVPGPASAHGCPDADGDGFPDPGHGAPGPIDACPHDYAPHSSNGCSDSDHDGIPNNHDRCPLQKGPKEAHGCPDRDRDGIPDKDDKCPRQYARASITAPGSAPRGCLGPLNASLPFDYYQGAHVRGDTVLFSVLSNWTARGPTGATVTLTCRGPGCPAAWPLPVRMRHPALNLIPLLRKSAAWRDGPHDVRLDARTEVTATISDRGALSRQLTLTGTEASRLRCETTKGKFGVCRS